MCRGLASHRAASSAGTRVVPAPGAARNSLPGAGARLSPAAQGQRAVAARGSRSFGGIVPSERESPGIVRPLATSPTGFLSGAWPPGSTLACHVDVLSEAREIFGFPWGNGDGVSSRPAYPSVGTGWYPRGGEQEAAAGRMLAGMPRARFSGVQPLFWV